MSELNERINKIRIFKDYSPKDILKKMKEISPKINSKLHKVRDWFFDEGCPDSYEMTILEKVLGLEKGTIENFHLFNNPINTIEIHGNYDKPKSVKQEKPGNKKKETKIKNSIRIHDIKKPGELICSYCDTLDESCIYCHPEDNEIKFIFGGHGTGEKVTDEIVALLCLKCRTELDDKPEKYSIEAVDRIANLEHSIKWAKAIIKTQAFRIAELENILKRN